MNILYLGNFHDVHSTEHQVARAFERLGHQVHRLGVAGTTHADIVEVASGGEYGLLLFAKAQFAEAAGDWPGAAEFVARMVKAVRPHVDHTVCWLWDLMCEAFRPSRCRWLEIVASAVDLCALTDGVSAARLPNAIVIRDGCPDDVDAGCPWAPPLAGDVLFLGTLYGDRRRLTDALARRFGPRLAVVTHGVQGPALTRLVRSYRVVVGPHDPCFPRYWSDRLAVVAGHGGLFAGPAIEGMADDGWVAGGGENDNYVATSADPDRMPAEIAESFEKRTPLEFDAVRRRGFAHARRNCLWENRVTQLLGNLRRPITRHNGARPSGRPF